MDWILPFGAFLAAHLLISAAKENHPLVGAFYRTHRMQSNAKVTFSSLESRTSSNLILRSFGRRENRPLSNEPFPRRIHVYCNTLPLYSLQPSAEDFPILQFLLQFTVSLINWLWLRRWVFRCLPVSSTLPLHLLLLAHHLLSEENVVAGKGCLGFLLWGCVIYRGDCSCHRRFQVFGMPWQAGTLLQLL